MVQKNEKLKSIVKAKGKSKPKSKSHPSKPKAKAPAGLPPALMALLAAQAGQQGGAPGMPGGMPGGLPGGMPGAMPGGMPGGAPMPGGGAPLPPPIGGGGLPPQLGPSSPAGAPPPMPQKPIGMGGPKTTMAQCPKHAAMVHSAYGKGGPTYGNGMGGPSNIAAPAEPPCTCGADGDPMASTGNRVAQAFDAKGGAAMPAPEQDSGTSGTETPLQNRSDGSPMEMNDGMGGSNTSADYLKGIAHGIAAGGLLGSMFQNLGGMFGGGAGAVGQAGQSAVQGAKGMVKDRAMQKIQKKSGGSNMNPQTAGFGAQIQGPQQSTPIQGGSGRVGAQLGGQSDITNPQEQALGYGAIQPNQMGARQGLVAPSFMHPNLPNQPQTTGFPLNTTSGLDEFTRNSALKNKLQNRTRYSKGLT